ncbi:hypothetical protein [Methylocapsa aurea]|uniref:hypothetical protein n=1 Tax=Methylocapsa aurea TaxID=663610 RepID=UPI0012EB8F60|nr:hypothetical protein [Methylocapsa aurea]
MSFHIFAHKTICTAQSRPDFTLQWKYGNSSKWLLVDFFVNKLLLGSKTHLSNRAELRQAHSQTRQRTILPSLGNQGPAALHNMALQRLSLIASNASNALYRFVWPHHTAQEATLLGDRAPKHDCSALN